MHLRVALPTLAFALTALALPTTHADAHAEAHADAHAAVAATATSAAVTAAPPANSAEAGEATARLAAAATASGLRPEVLDLAMRAYARAAAEGRVARPVLTVADYSRPSREPRLWVLDLERDSVLARELVAHGKNSGGDLATRFSNVNGSEQTSLGTFVT
ncbi:MAG TPA: murein L,D-transpeptidase catalytic domain family protein, partial [Gemmatimonadales bacterium]|nr:murein L,D-transpeptidase catalytic domain family protein [Gemmatimonadales bacterium]